MAIFIKCISGWTGVNYRIYSNKRPTSNKRPCQRQKTLISAQPRISAHPTPLPPTKTPIRDNKRPSRRRSFLQSILQKPCFATSSLFGGTIYCFVAKYTTTLVRPADVKHRLRYFITFITDVKLTELLFGQIYPIKLVSNLRK